MTKTNKRDEAVRKLIANALANPGIETAGPLRDYIGSFTYFSIDGEHYKLTFYPNNHNPRCEIEKLAV